MSGHGSPRGFTLVEVVLALVILSMVAAMVYGAFYVSHQAITSGEADAYENQRLRVAEDVMGRQIRSTVFYFARDEVEDYLPYFYGRADYLTFVSAAPQSGGGSGLAVVTYQVQDGQLVLEERVAFTADDLYEPPLDARVERAVLLDGFGDFWFEYLPFDSPDLRWQQLWDARDEDTLPAMVRLTVEGLPFFAFQPWRHEIPVMTVAYGWGVDEFRDPPEDEDDFEFDDPNELLEEE